MQDAQELYAWVGYSSLEEYPELSAALQYGMQSKDGFNKIDFSSHSHCYLQVWTED